MFSRFHSTLNKPKYSKFYQWLDSYGHYYKINDSKTTRWIFGSFACTIATAFYFRQPIYKFLSGESAKIAQQTIKHEDVVRETEKLTERVLNDLISDPKTNKLFVDFITDVLNDENTQQATIEFINSPPIQKKLYELINDILSQLKLYIKVY